ncbi:multicopper oxidase domain-containing protein, partial [Hafnia paralvei]
MGQFEVVSPTVNHYRGGMRANYTVEKCSFFQRQGETMLHSKTYYIAAMETDWDYSPNRTWEAEMFRGQESPATVFLDKQGGFIGSRETMLHSKTYYIAAMETDWDYSPNRTWEAEMFRGQESPATVFLDKQGGFIGSRYKKVVYRQFTNDKFTKQVERTPDMEHLGIMGPMIHADVGDKIKVVFKNMASRPYSIHAHGVKTETPDVYHTKPGETHTYYWYVTKNTGPTT